jgi:hypothetical protein
MTGEMKTRETTRLKPSALVYESISHHMVAAAVFFDSRATFWTLLRVGRNPV